MTNVAASGHVLELAGVDDTRAAHRVPVRQSALAHVGHDLSVLPRVRDTRARRQAVLAKDFQASERLVERVGAVPRIEGQPALLFAAPLVAAVVGPTQSDHRITLGNSSGSGPGAAATGAAGPAGADRGRPPDSQGAGGRVVAPGKAWRRRKRRRRAPRSRKIEVPAL